MIKKLVAGSWSEEGFLIPLLGLLRAMITQCMMQKLLSISVLFKHETSLFLIFSESLESRRVKMSDAFDSYNNPQQFGDILSCELICLEIVCFMYRSVPLSSVPQVAVMERKKNISEGELNLTRSRTRSK